MVELKWTNLYTTLRVTLFCTWCHVFYRSFANVTLMFDHVQCHCTIIWQAFLRNLDCTVARNIETMSLEMRIWPWIYDTLIYINECTLNSRFVYVDVFSYIQMKWRHDKVVRQRKCHATSRHSFITTVWWYNILYQTGYFL